MRCLAALVAALVILAGTAAAEAADRPNILWISCEDISPHLGCYGDDQAITPHLDALAEEGVRFTQSHHIHGVCRPARTGIILGMYPTSNGINHMRCTGILPDDVKPFPLYLKEAGYYCTNNSKTDYAFKWDQSEVWDESSRKAHWRNRPDDQTPFFAVFNFTVCHESQVWPGNHSRHVKRLSEDQVHDPSKMELPAYYPDTPKVRESMARLYDVITVMDMEAGKILAQLEEDGLADDTIVFFWSDHGDGLPRAKRWVYDSGTWIPMLARVPEKFRTGSYGSPGTTDERLISMIDLAPTMLTLAGVEVPEHMHGRPFMGPDQPEPRQYIHGARDRIDERYDLVRMVRDDRYRYMRNYMRWYPALRLIGYAERNAIRQEMRRLFAEGTLKDEAAQFLRTPRPFEELYDTKADPDEVNNLADDPKYADVLERMRGECDRWMLATRDANMLAEPFLEDAERQEGFRRAAVAGPDGRQRVQDLMEAAALAANASQDNLKQLVELTGHDDPAVRWWAVMGLGNADEAGQAALGTIQHALSDDSVAVQVAAARALDHLGHPDQALPILTAAMKDGNAFTRMWAITVLDEMDERARPALDVMKAARKNQPSNYIQRVADQAVAELEQ